VLIKLFRKGLIDLISANFMMQFVGFGLLILLPRFVSEAELGQIKIIQTYTDLLVVVGGLGMNTAVLKLCSERREEHELLSILRLAALRTLSVSILVYASLVLVTRMGLLSADPVVVLWLPVYAAIVPFAALALLGSAFLQARKRIREMARAQILVKLQSVGIIALATWQFGMKGYIFSSIGAFALALWPYARLIGPEFLRASRIRASRMFRSIAGYSVLGNLFNSLGKYADIYVLGLFATDPVHVGYYSLATIFVIPASVVTSSIQTIVTPYLSERSSDRTWFSRSLIRTQLQTFALALVVAVVVRVGAGLVIALLYDPGYSATLPYLDVLLVFFVLRSGYAVTAAGHIALGLTKYNFVASLVMAPMALILTYGALMRFGFEGVAWAKVITAGVMIILYSLLARRAIRIAPKDG
jgi:O-antigen/teichoic acid export membrane protein